MSGYNRIYENDCFTLYIIVAVMGMYGGLYDLSPRIT